MGFISTRGSALAARACRYCALPISEPSGSAAALLDMFWDLKGATLSPERAKIRQRAAAMRLLPTEEAVPCTMTVLAVK